ncbi:MULTISPECIES: GIY-YIG nuclease family protein [unclassified Actinoplanes]|uniref:GIY-YIG nuclease family protein n=1 Tax=unclassified Actinoplanes TaxID=2626549 RepID=UPI0009AFA911|nr:MULTISPECIES: GIY-YIG nuclease family protein [unclassified Actinoplanes]
MTLTTLRLPVVPPRPTGWLDPCCIYRFYNDAGVLLYVGITGSPSVRFESHRANSAWWGQADLTRTLVYWRETKGHAEAEEIAAIIVKRPVFNIAHRPGPRITNRQPAYRG